MPNKRTKRVMQLEQMVSEALTDAHGESEQRVAFYTMIDEHLKLPFQTRMLGVTVSVKKIDLSDADEIIAECQRGREKLNVPILDLPLPDPAPVGSEWIEAYRHWLRG